MKMVKKSPVLLIHKQQLMNKAANDSRRVSGKDRKKPPALGTNKIAGFGGFRPLESSEENKGVYSPQGPNLV